MKIYTLFRNVKTFTQHGDNGNVDNLHNSQHSIYLHKLYKLTKSHIIDFYITTKTINHCNPCNIMK